MLEQSIVELTEEVIKLTSIMGSQSLLKAEEEEEEEVAEPPTQTKPKKKAKRRGNGAAKPAEDPQSSPPPQYTEENVRQALLAYCASKSTEQGRTLLAQFDAETISDLGEQHYADVITRIAAATR